MIRRRLVYLLRRGYIFWSSTCLFFFSSRRRHTRSLCDWSSDVCSSDLEGAARWRESAWRAARALGQALRWHVLLRAARGGAALHLGDRQLLVVDTRPSGRRLAGRIAAHAE